ncbi:DMT family transporter [Bradyrhizobium sp. SYSU BS000235]|uniref:DMT family transporter n=1 Tax=Bradyrhizobium sp. SYSU BS000235 TaxID=3411332 RepID=UPI003C7202AA
MDTRTPQDVLTEPLTVKPIPPGHGSRSAGYLMLLVTALSWGINWPVGKHLLTELPPLTMRGAPGALGAVLLAVVVLAKGQSLRVPLGQLPRLVLYSVLTVTGWMALIGLALVYLPASETAILGAMMPVLAAALAWPILGERPSVRRVISMIMALAGLVILLGGDGIAANQAKMPGIVLALSAALSFALGTVLAKRKPLQLPQLTAAVWQIAIGCVPIALYGLLFEHPQFAHLSTLGWSLFAYSTIVQVCIGFACWFGALQRLPASVAAIGTLLIPVIGVVASAVSLGEPLGVVQVAALGLTVAGVMLASRS